MKALPLWQPWSSLVALGAKRVETRGYPPWELGLRAGQRIAIHATKGGLAKREELEWLTEHGEAFRTLGAELLDGFGTIKQIAEALPRGAVICTCLLDRASRITVESAAALRDRDPAEHSYGDYTPGRWAWVLKDVERLPEPVPFRGSQGAFDVPDHLLAGHPEPAQGVLL